MNLQDPSDNKILICIDCNKSFVFTAGEQQYYLTRKLSEPRRCPECRAIRKQSITKGNDNG